MGTRATVSEPFPELLSQAVVDGLEEGVLVVRGEWEPVSWNESALRILGVTDGQMARREPPPPDELGLRHADGRLMTVETAPGRRAIETDSVVRSTLRRTDAQGKDHWITAVARPIRIAGRGDHLVCTFAEVTGAVEAERRLREERDRAQMFLDVASTVVVVCDHEARIELINRLGCELLGYVEDELIGFDWFGKLSPDGADGPGRAAFVAMLTGEAPLRPAYESIVRTKDGRELRIAWRNTVLRDADGEITSILSSGEDVTERRRAEAQVAFMAYHDRLTGLPNRTLLEEQLQRDIARAARTDATVALLYFDLDRFKLVNDSLGHGAGDAVLVETAARVSALLRAGDVLARQGGDEFLLLLDTSDAPDTRAAALAAGRRIAEALDTPFQISGAEFHVGASIGVALCPHDAEDAEELLARADAAMYQAKRSGGGAVAFYEADTRDAREHLEMVTRLRRAIGADELRLHFQPIVALGPGGLTGFEALVRWEDPDRGLVPPGDFIPLAEETGLIDALGAWVLEALCLQAAAWAEKGFHPRLSFNLSPRQLRKADIVAAVATQIESHGLRPEQFCVELTESAVLSDEQRGTSLLAKLAEAGLMIAIDDFGAGHSSLARLRDLPVQVLKVDRSFLARVPEDAGSTAVVAAILTLGEALGMTTVVEGVEREDQLAFLRAHGCPSVQGFLLGRPEPATAAPVREAV